MRIAGADSLDWQTLASGVNQKLRDQQKITEARRAKLQAELDGLTRQQQQLVMAAPYPGRFYLLNPDLKAGDWVSKGESLAVLVAPGSFRVETYLAEADIQRLRVGDQGSFYPESGSPASILVTVQSIDPDASHELMDGILSSIRGGALPVREHGKSLVPEHAVYRVVLGVNADGIVLPFGVMRGQVQLNGKPQAWLLNHVRFILAVIRREAGF